MKLEIKHLAPYLPYGLKVTKDDWGKIFKMDNDGTTLNCVGIDYILNTKAKPILLPFSDFHKYYDIFKKEVYQFDDADLNFIHVNGFNGFHIEYEFDIDNPTKESVPFNFYLKLLELHFDVFGLIKNGLAIDINSIENVSV